MNKRTQLSKFLSLMLRHRPADFGLMLDDNGFVAVDIVWGQVQKRFGDAYTFDEFSAVARQPDPTGKQRFEIVNDKIRARYGHTAATVTYPPVEPPEFLYHGTTPAALDSIREQGLTPQKRQYVHLSLDVDWAQMVGQRHAQTPVVLRIRAGEMQQAGYHFYRPEPKHYLTDSVPVQFIDFPDA